MKFPNDDKVLEININGVTEEKALLLLFDQRPVQQRRK